MFTFQVTKDIPLYSPLFSQLKLCQAFGGDIFHAVWLPLTSLRERSSQMGWANTWHWAQEERAEETVLHHMKCFWWPFCWMAWAGVWNLAQGLSVMSGLCHGSFHCLPPCTASLLLPVPGLSVVSPGTSWFYSPANEPWDWQSGMRPWDFCPFVIWKATFRKLCYKLLQPRSELLRGLEVPRLNWPVQIQFTVQSWFERDICCCFLHPTQGAFPSEVSCSFSYNILITPSLLVCFFQHSLNWKFHIWNQLRFHECCCAS